MSFETHSSALRRFPIACLIVFLVFQITSGKAVAAQNDERASTQNSNQSSNRSSDAEPTATLAAMNPAVTSDGSRKLDGQSDSDPKQPGNGAANQSTSAATPLTSGQKFKYFARSSFMPPMPYALSVLSGVFSEAIDKDHGRHMTAGDFMADSMTHAARSFAFRTTANFFEKFAFASAFKQDPRYFRSDKKGFGRIGYAVSRVFVTRSDLGRDQFNASFLAGGLVAAGISNAWSRPEDRTASSTMSRFGLHVAYRALSNIIQELFSKK